MNVFNLDSCPSSPEELSNTWLQGKGPMPSRLIIFFFAGFAWALWTIRNKMAIEKSCLKAPTKVGGCKARGLYDVYCNVVDASVLLKKKDKECVSQVPKLILDGQRTLGPRRLWPLMCLRFSF